MLKFAASRCKAVFIILTFMSVVGADSLFAQRNFGISYSPPVNADRFQNDLRYLKTLGISSLLIEDAIETDQMTAIEESGFDVYISIPVIFPTIFTLEQEREALLNKWSRYIDFYRDFDNVRGLGLFRHGQTHSRRFRDFFESLIGEINTITDTPLFYISSNVDTNDFSELFDFRIYHADDTSAISNLASFEAIEGIAYLTQEREFDVRRFQTMLVQTQEIGQCPIFLDWDWFVTNRSSNELIEQVIQSYAFDANALFANPRSVPKEASPNWLILIFLIIWGSIVMHYSLMPTYRKSLIRYFDNHKFLINDVIDRHLRIGQSSAVILFQQGLLGGLYLLALTKYTLSPLGFEALIYHLPLYSYVPNYLVIFLTGFSFFLLINIICMAWLFLVNSDLYHISQSAIFQLWPQHINLFVITVLIALILAESSIIIINIFALIYLIVSLGSFIFAVIDAGKHTVTPFYYYPLTVIIYGIVFAVFIIWLYLASGFPEIWDLAVSL